MPNKRYGIYAKKNTGKNWGPAWFAHFVKQNFTHGSSIKKCEEELGSVSSVGVIPE